MILTDRHSRRELWVTLSIWAALMVMAVIALLVLRSNAIRIIDHIHYVNVSRGAKAEVLYAEAEKNARKVLEKAELLNRESREKIAVPANYEPLQKSIELYNDALEMDIRPEFAPERTMHYELLGQVHDAAGNHAEELLAHGRAFISQGNYEDALGYIAEIRKIKSDAPEPLVLLAQLHVNAGATSQALAVLDDLYSSYTVPAKARWVKAQLLAQAQKPEEAIEELTKSVEQRPENLTFRRDLGTALAGAGETGKAVSVMQAGLDDGGWLDAAYLHLYGDNLIAAEDYDEAIRVLKQADELAPYSGDVQWSLARAYHLAGNAGLAASTLRRATEIKPELHDQIF